MVQAPQSFVEQLLWPQFEELERELRSHVFAMTERVIHAAIYAGANEPAEANGSGGDD